MDFHFRLLRTFRWRDFDERLDEQFDFGIVGQLLQPVLRKFRPRNPVGVTAVAHPEFDADVIERNDVTNQRRAIRQRIRFGAGGKTQSAKPERKYCPKNLAHAMVVTNPDAARKEIQNGICVSASIYCPWPDKPGKLFRGPALRRCSALHSFKTAPVLNKLILSPARCLKFKLQKRDRRHFQIKYSNLEGCFVCSRQSKNVPPGFVIDKIKLAGFMRWTCQDVSQGRF